MSNTDSNKMTFKTATIQLLDYSWKIFIGISAVVTVATMITDFKETKEHKLLTSLIVLAVTIFISMILLILKMIKDGAKDKVPLVLSSELVNIVNALYEEEKFLDVVRFGSTVSRYLWINGHNKERIAIGELVEDAASKESRISEQVSALIDDIGWTYHIVGNDKLAVTNITNGVDKAVENNLFYLAAKGERHLSGIAKHNNKETDFSNHLDNAEKYTAQIQDSSDKSEMEASLHLAKAKHLFETGKLPEAEASAKLAMQIFKNDLDRIVKVHSLLGNIYLEQGKTNPSKMQKAKDEFNNGYERCKDIRKDELARNAIGLAKIALLDGDVKSYIKYLKEARAVYVSQQKNKEVNEIDVMLKNIKT